ncbi:MAG: carotenoid biosynthesis protein [Actinomycetota bacterium]|nr:carotenoid biosynthesis protein [Actinomycetota bacterium]
MSVRVYTGPHSDRGGGPSGWISYLPWALAGLTILGQITWVLLGSGGRTVLTALTVVTFFLSSATHAFITRGAAWASGYLAISLVFGWGIEFLGLQTSFPFGEYAYSDALGPSVGGVPVVIPMAWAMMSYPVLLAAQRLAATGLGTALVGGWLLASWDLFLDPQMVGQGYWTWADAGWALPGIPGIPLQNFLGWLLGAIVLMFLLDRLPRKVASEAVPTLMLTWVFASNVVANLLFFDRPGVALWGGLCMGVVIAPWLWRLWSQPQW